MPGAIACCLAVAACDRQEEAAVRSSPAHPNPSKTESEESGAPMTVSTGVKPAPSPAPATKPAVPAEEPIPETISFNDNIQPILSEYCYHCHGPDSGTREPKKAPMRLDRMDQAFAPRENGKPVIIKGKPEESLLIKLIREKDPDAVMPPPSSHKVLQPREIALLEKWVAQGAPYEQHWSFIPVKRPEVPAAGKDWALNPIDNFVAEKLDKAGLKPNPAEDPARFYRRMHFDLTGLPPSEEDSKAFVEKAKAGMNEAVAAEADRLLATTASAEHFARHWLDAARYADTHGIHIDNYRSIWPYRDWVVNAFKANMPWDQFTIEQIAGDMLPNRTLDQQVATGFDRCLATTGEGGAIPEEYDAIYAKDRTETVSAVWLGLTTGCATCHDHKFDPISTKEFYSLTAFFRNSTMQAMDGNNAEHPPVAFVPAAADRARWDGIGGDIAAAEKELAGRSEQAKGDFANWLTTAKLEAPQETGLALRLPLTEAEGPLRGMVDGKPREWAAELARVAGPNGPAPVLSKPVDLGDLGSFSRGDQVSYGGFVRVEGAPNGAVIAKMDAPHGYRGWDFFIKDGHPAAHVIDTWPQSADRIEAPQALSPGEWHHVMVTFDGTQASEQALTLYVDGVRQNGMMEPKTVGKTIETTVPLRLGSREGGDSTLNGPVALQDFRFYRRLMSEGEIAALANSATLGKALAMPAAQRSKEQNEALLKYFLTSVDRPSQALRTKLDALRNEQTALRSRGAMTLVMEEKPEMPYAHVLIRGIYSDKGDRVEATTPAALPPMAADSPHNRLGLAKWLADPGNPLPARVTVNRTWYYFFGTGIVETTEDFGIMGARPSHPHLLDWLAAEFTESKWDYRHMLKLIVTSQTYRQSGTVTPEKLEKDPANRLLSRGPRYRLDAEEIRDLALSASGLLSNKVGGPPVKPYQPEGIWEAVAMKESNTRNYKADSGESLYRRSIYTFWKRTAPNPTMEILNAPTRETFCVRRERTDTPLQAFVTLNDPQFVETSRRLAENAMKNSSDFDVRLDQTTQPLLGRTFEPDERQIVHQTLDDALASFRADPGAAAKFIATGETAPDKTLDVTELAAWTLVASQVFNLDETLNK
jgi:hypothetical protein